MWRVWCKALGEKATPCNKESDRIAIIRTIILLTYLVTNLFIVTGVVKHWNDNTPSSRLEKLEQEILLNKETK